MRADNTHMTEIGSSDAIEEQDESLIENIENVNDPKVVKILCQLIEEVKQLKLDNSKKEREIETLKDEIHGLKNKVLNNERYLSKDSLKITNPPITQHGNQTFEILTFLREQLLVTIDKKSPEACHLLKKLQDENAPPALTLKIVHFRAKDTVYSLVKKLSKFRHPLNSNTVFILETLTYHDAEIEKAADNMNLITTTHNCQVKVLVNQGSRKVFKQINELKQLGVAKNQIVNKKQHIRGSNNCRKESIKRVIHQLFTQLEVNKPTKPPCKNVWINTAPQLISIEVKTTY